jgi:hypothetical protein
MPHDDILRAHALYLLDDPAFIDIVNMDHRLLAHGGQIIPVVAEIHLVNLPLYPCQSLYRRVLGGVYQ